MLSFPLSLAALAASETGAEAGASGTSFEGAAPAFTLPVFPVASEGVSAYTVRIASVLDHTDRFYQRCCDADITAFSGENAQRDEHAVRCPVEPADFPACFFADCLCSYRNASGDSFELNGSTGGSYLQYAGHAGYDYVFASGTPLVAVADGLLCKAIADPINGHFGAPTAWDRFHTFYIDHGEHDGRAYASWYLHAEDLTGEGTVGEPLASLAPGECAAVTEGQAVATVGNVGTFVPHLHFEVRRRAPDAGPEDPAALVIDPYGWTGDSPDPWSDPAENPQAESQLAPLWAACGNGRIDAGETCDAGTPPSHDDCSASCQAVPEPGALTLEGAAILATSWLARRRRRCPLSGR